tara:strand:- start:292 stop:423 length:132 start_codon:yes stop_codon:yes gene_type:complete
MVVFVSRSNSDGVTVMPKLTKTAKAGALIMGVMFALIIWSAAQ